MDKKPQASTWGFLLSRCIVWRAVGTNRRLYMENCVVIGHITPEGLIALSGSVGAIISIMVAGLIQIIKIARNGQE
jgi:hypothetical protein